MHSCVFLVWIHRFSQFFGSILWPLSLHSQDEVKAAQKNSRRPDHVYSKAVRSPKTNRIAKCFDQRQRFIIAALFISEIYPHACCWKWAFSRAMSHNTFFRQTLWSGEWTQGLGPRSNFPWPFVASFLCWLSHLGRGKFDKITTFADIARENAHFQQHAWGYISLLKINWGVAMIELCLWSKKSAIRWVFGPQTAFE